MTLSVSLPPGASCDRATLAAGFEALYEANHARLPCTLAIDRRDGHTTFLIACPPELRAFLEAQVYAAAPAARIDVIDPNREDAGDARSVLLYLKPVSGRRAGVRGDGSDGLRMLLAVMDRLPPPARSSLSLRVRPATRRERVRDAAVARKADRLAAAWSPALARRYLVRRADAGFPARMLLDAAAVVLSQVRRPASLGGWASGDDPGDGPLFSAWITVQLSKQGVGSVGRLLAELAGAGALLGLGAVLCHSRARDGDPFVAHPHRSGLITPEELADFWHLPPADAETAGVMPSPNRELEPPAWLPTPEERPDLTALGEGVFRDRVRTCGLLPEDRLRHLVVLGKTGTGKSTLLEQLIASDIARGQGVGLVDPHGELCESVATAVPRRRTNDVVLFDAADVSHPVGFNPLRCDRVADRPLVASGVLAAFKKLYPDFFGPRMEHVFRNALLACVATPGLTFVHLQRFLCDPPFRRHVVERGDDPLVRQFWLKEFSAMPQKLQAEAVAPVQNKVGAFVSHPVLRHVLGQPDARLDLRRVMDEGKILLCSVSKGRIGDDGAALLGSFVVTSVQLAAMSRADVPEAERRPFALVVDEVGSFATDGLAAMLSESRKYRTSLTGALQHVSQLSPVTQDALFGNAGSLLAFQCGADDAAYLAGQLGPGVTPQDLLNVPRYHAYARLLVDGRPTPPFTLRTIPPVSRARDPARLDAIRRASRRRYTKASTAVAAEVRAATLAA